MRSVPRTRQATFRAPPTPRVRHRSSIDERELGGRTPQLLKQLPRPFGPLPDDRGIGKKAIAFGIFSILDEKNLIWFKKRIGACSDRKKQS
jgi:hypothetical protein